MNWYEIVLEIKYEYTSNFSDALLSAGAMSVTVEDADAGTNEEHPVFDEPDSQNNGATWSNSRITTLLSADTNPDNLVAYAATKSGLEQIPSYIVRTVEEKDWVSLTQSQFDPIPIGRNIWIVPSWHEIPSKNAIIIKMDPGLAFGTGSHPTTQLCIKWLEEYVKKEFFVLDYGCGSGILAIAASKLGAQHIEGVDIDSQAIVVAAENAKRNNCTISFYLPEDFTMQNSGNKYNIVIANILSRPLQSLATTLTFHIAANGYIALSGILKQQANDVISAYAPYVKLSLWKQQEEWVLLTGQKIN